jgi:biopolymer transport protein ExbB
MKPFVLALLALLFNVCAATAQAPAPREPARPTPLPAGVNPPAPGDNARTRIGGGPGDSVTTLPASTRAPLPAKPEANYIKPGQEPNTAMSLLKLVESGGWAMYPLILMSVLAIMLVLVFLATLRRSAILTAHYMNTADVLLKKRDYLGLLAISARHNEVVARVVQRTLDFATKNPSASFEVVKDVAESEGSSQASSLQHRVTYLADIGTLSPMVGLFGTVVGIVRSFGSLGSGMVGQNRDWALASGVSEALVATGAGLVVGIVSFMFYAFFRNKVQRLISDLEVASAHIVGLMALNYKRREPSRAALEEEF